MDSQLLAHSINVIRGLAIDGVEKAKSGHPGMPMGCAPMAVALWTQQMVHNPRNPKWFNRDRFVLSAGHGSMLLYAMLFATGYDMTLDDLRAFRQWGSRTPGHPENHLTPGVEMATGPLGQGISTAVGMAIAEEFLANRYNRKGHSVVHHHTYVIASDGDLMEGVAQEAASLAGHLALSKLIVLYDSNRITIDGSTDLAYTENVSLKFEAMGWHVLECDGLDPNAVDRAIQEGQAQTKRPTLIICRTIIGFGSPNKSGKQSSHGAPLGPDEAKAAKSALGLPADEEFYFPPEVAEALSMVERGQAYEDEWNERMAKYAEEFPAEAAELRALMDGTYVPSIDWPVFDSAIANRDASHKVINAIAAGHPTYLSGCADLAESVKTIIHDSPMFQAGELGGRNLAFGIREHAMAAAANGITLHGGARVSVGSFLQFADYCRPSIRLAALMECPTIFLFSHDSIGLGEDGPTHQPIEHVMSLRLIPNLDVVRPGDGNEVAVAWQMALESKDHPTLIVTTRQGLPILTPPASGHHPARRGAYILREASDEEPQVILIGTGSELHVAAQAAEMLEGEGIRVRVVSMPSWFQFERQDESYKASIFPSGVPCLSVEAGSTLGWQRYAQHQVGIDRFGASAPGPFLMRHFGFTAENVANQARSLLSG